MLLLLVFELVDVSKKKEFDLIVLLRELDELE